MPHTLPDSHPSHHMWHATKPSLLCCVASSLLCERSAVSASAGPEQPSSFYSPTMLTGLKFKSPKELMMALRSPIMLTHLKTKLPEELMMALMSSSGDLSLRRVS